MSLVRWGPFRELQEVSDRLGRVFARPGATGHEALAFPDWAPAVDIAETAEEFVIKADLPGVKKEDVKVSFSDDTVRIEGERKQEKDEHGKKYHRLERAYGAFVRTFVVPNGVKEGAASAEFTDGVLQVHLPKTNKAAAKSIEVKVS